MVVHADTMVRPLRLCGNDYQNWYSAWGLPGSVADPHPGPVVFEACRYFYAQYTVRGPCLYRYG
jgi:hypothetical protein